MSEPNVHIHLHVASEKTSLAVIKLVTAALAPKVTAEQLDELNAEINQSTDELSEVLKSAADRT